MDYSAIALNGVYFHQNNFNYSDRDGDKVRGSLGFCAFGNIHCDNISDFQTATNDTYNNHGLITFGLDGGGYYICFDYCQNPKTNNPPIVIEYNNGETYINEDGQEKFLVLPVANNFDEFLNMLYEEF